MPSDLAAWKNWCASEGEDTLASSEAAPVAFLHTLAHTVRAQTQVPKSVSTTRFHHLKWIVANMGAEIRIDQTNRPSRRASADALPPEQRIATDLEVRILSPGSPPGPHSS